MATLLPDAPTAKYLLSRLQAHDRPPVIVRLSGSVSESFDSPLGIFCTVGKRMTLILHRTPSFPSGLYQQGSSDKVSHSRVFGFQSLFPTARLGGEPMN